MATKTAEKTVKANIRYVHMAPQKVRLIARLVKNMDIETAEHLLNSLPKRATKPIWKAISSAAANAVHNAEMDRKRLFVRSINVNESMTLKRHRPRAQGRAFLIRKRFSHICVEVAQRPETKKTTTRATKTSQTSKTPKAKTTAPKKTSAVISKTEMK